MVAQELGLRARRADDGMRGEALVVPEMWVPGTTNLRTSVLATWTDTLTGLLALGVLRPRVPLTLDLDVHLYRPAPSEGMLRGHSQMVKAGRSVVVVAVELTDEDGVPVAAGTASFMMAPDPNLRFPDDAPHPVYEGDEPPLRLLKPLAERTGCTIREPGVAALPGSKDVRNGSGLVHGGFIALVVEEAALSRTPGATLASMALRYLQPVRIGPAVAVAKVARGLGRVEVRDEGNDNRLCVLATTRTFAPPD
jgi:acyl-coenzyme A thioesterase PaaI-like protein